MSPGAGSHDPVLGVATKSIPPRFWGRTASEVAAERPGLDELLTPVLALDAAAEAHNVRVFADWARQQGLEFAPHGKTSMAPELWRHVLDAGALALTVATPWQAMVARSDGVGSILLANELIDPQAIAWVASELDADPDFSFTCFIDSVDSLAALAASSGERPIDVLVEIGARGGRAGARDDDTALGVAWGASREPRVRLVGVAGWEGPFGHDREPESIAAVRAFLDTLVARARRYDEEGFFEVERPLISAGGSAFPDVVAEATAPLAPRFRRLVRSGAFQVHDSGHYAALSPLADRLRPALFAWARVLSRPTDRVAILDAGRRDLPFDAGMPVPLRADGSPWSGADIPELNDQHAFLRLPPGAVLRVGDVVRLGISHPCTAFDKWRTLPIVDDADAERPVITGFLQTLF